MVIDSNIKNINFFCSEENKNVKILEMCAFLRQKNEI
jgi:hypothetical protein